MRVRVRAARLEQAHGAPAAAHLVARQGRAHTGERSVRPRRAPAPRAHNPRPPAAAAVSATAPPKHRERAPSRAHSRALQVRSCPRLCLTLHPSRLRALTPPTCSVHLPAAVPDDAELTHYTFSCSISVAPCYE